MHWVAVSPEYQGFGLGKAIVCEGMKRFLQIESDRNVYLHTQTWSYKAIGIYKKFGFEIIRKKDEKKSENADFDKAMEVLKGCLR